MKKVNSEEFKLIELGLIDRPAESARMSISHDEIMELAGSIKEQGLLQPIVLNIKGKRFEIVAGDRRYLATKQLGSTQIMARVTKMTALAVDLARGVENLQRRDLTPFEEGTIYTNLVLKHKLDIEQVGKRMGKSPGVVRRRMDILAMPESLQRAIHEKKISLTVGEELLGCSDPTHREYLIEMAIEHGVTKEVARLWVSDWRKGLRGSKGAGEEGGRGRNVMEPEIFYRACEACREAVDINKLREFRVCPACHGMIVEALKGGGKSE